MSESIRHEYHFSPEGLRPFLNTILGIAGVGEVVRWTWYREAIIGDPGDEAQLRNEIVALEDFSGFTQGERVLLELELQLADYDRPLRAYLKFLVGRAGELHLEDVLADELPLSDPQDIKDTGKLRERFEAAASAVKSISEVLVAIFKLKDILGM